VPDSLKAVEQKRDYYLQIMQKAQQLDDQPLINLILEEAGPSRNKERRFHCQRMHRYPISRPALRS